MTSVSSPAAARTSRRSLDYRCIPTEWQSYGPAIMPERLSGTGDPALRRRQPDVTMPPTFSSQIDVVVSFQYNRQKGVLTKIFETGISEVHRTTQWGDTAKRRTIRIQTSHRRPYLYRRPDTSARQFVRNGGPVFSTNAESPQKEPGDLCPLRKMMPARRSLKS